MIDIGGECNTDNQCKEYNKKAIRCIKTQVSDFINTALKYEISYYKNRKKRCVLMIGE